MLQEDVGIIKCTIPVKVFDPWSSLLVPAPAVLSWESEKAGELCQHLVEWLHGRLLVAGGLVAV